MMVPSGWNTSRLSDVCDIINGRPFKPHEWKKSGLPIIRIQNLNGSNEYNFYDGEFSEKVLIKSGQLLFAWSGSKGTSFGPHIWRGIDGLLNYHTWRMNVKNDVDQDFFFQYLKLITSKIESKAHGASALVHTQKIEMEKFLVVLPPLLEQRKIAKILSCWDKSMATTEKLIAASKQQKKALMQQLLTGKKRFAGFEDEWKESNLANVCHMQAGKFVKASEIHNLPSVDLFPCYGGNGLRGFTKSSTHKGKYSLIGRQGALCGNITLANNQFHATEHAVVVTPNVNINTDWLYYMLIFLNLNQYATGQAQPGLSVGNLEKVSICFPCQQLEQQKIAAVLTAADKEIELLEQKLSHLKNEKKALMQQLLTGKRRVSSLSS